MNLPDGKKIYFASDFHLGIPDYESSMEREKLLCKWLDNIKNDAYCIYLVGDIFDVWFEYKTVVPRGYTRFLGKLAALSDAGIRIEVFTGNHDLWMQDYFQKELNIPVHKNELHLTVNNIKFFIAHGDGLGPGDNGYKFLKKVMSNKFAQWLYGKLHPDWGVGIAAYFSRKGPKHKSLDENQFLGEDKEWLVLFCKEVLSKEHYDYFIFGHRHIAITYPLNNSSTYINLGDWLSHYTYAVFDGNKTTLEKFIP